MKKDSLKHLKKLLRRWHGRAGISVAIVVVVIAVTGVLLNHTGGLGLDEKYVTQELVLGWYGIEESEPKSVGLMTNEIWTAFLAEQVFVGGKFVGDCDRLINVVFHRDHFDVACMNKLLVVSDEFQLIEEINQSSGLPVPIESMQVIDDELFVVSANQFYKIDEDALQFLLSRPPPTWRAVSSVKMLALPDTEYQNIVRQVLPSHSITWERFILDLHSGRLFSKAGPWVFDLAAVLLIFLSCSGTYVWFKKGIK